MSPFFFTLVAVIEGSTSPDCLDRIYELGKIKCELGSGSVVDMAGVKAGPRVRANGRLEEERPGLGAFAKNIGFCKPLSGTSGVVGFGAEVVMSGICDDDAAGRGDDEGLERYGGIWEGEVGIRGCDLVR